MKRTCSRPPTSTATTPCWSSTPPRSSRASTDRAGQEAARPCAAAPSSTSSTRTPPAPASRSRPRPSGCRPTSSTSRAKGSSVSKGESLKDTALTLEAMGADAVVIRHRRERRAAPARALGLDRRLASSTPATAPTSTPPRRCSTRSRCAATSPAAGRPRGPPRHDRRRRPAQPGRALATCCCSRTLGAEVTLVAPPTLLPVGVETWPCATSYDLDAAPHGRRRRDDAARAARADERGVLPERARVQPPLRPRRAPHGAAARPRDRHAPRPDEPRHGDRRRGRRLAALGDRRAGRQRRERADGRALPAARRRAARRRHRPRATARRPEMRDTYVVRGARLLGGERRRPRARATASSPRSAAGLRPPTARR